jgi:hypothetical protein
LVVTLRFTLSDRPDDVLFTLPAADEKTTKAFSGSA